MGDGFLGAIIETLGRSRLLVRYVVPDMQQMLAGMRRANLRLVPYNSYGRAASAVGYGGVLVEGPIVLYHSKYYRCVLHYDLDDVLNTIYTTMGDITSFVQ